MEAISVGRAACQEEVCSVRTELCGHSVPGCVRKPRGIYAA